MILHIDMDAFYASVEQRDDPSLIGKPVAVGGSPKGRGVISAASYEARKFGVHSAMPAAKAVRVCPQLIFVKGRMDHYASISRQIREIFFRFTSLVEPLSLDEAFLDVTGCERLFGAGEEIAWKIKDAIWNEVGLVASAGVAPNKYLAKLASDLDKPNGMTIVDPDRIQEFLDPLDISRVWGIGKQGLKKFHAIGVRTIRQLREIPPETLKTCFGINGEHFYKLARGIDSRSVVPDREAKSVSHETTFAVDIDQRDVLCAWLQELAWQVGRRMRRYELRGKTVKLKLRFSDFQTISRSSTLREPTNSTDTLWREGKSMICRELDEAHAPIRLIGIGLSNLSRTELRQKSLFEEDEHQKNEQLESTTDAIREKFGSTSVRPAAGIEHRVRHRPDPKPGDD